jgi:hypothetical protein
MPNIPPTAEEAHESPNALIRFMEQAKGNSNKWNALCDELKQAKNKFDKLEPAKKQQLKKNAAIGGAVVLGLFGLKKLFGGKKRK